MRFLIYSIKRTNNDVHKFHRVLIYCDDSKKGIFFTFYV